MSSTASSAQASEHNDATSIRILVVDDHTLFRRGLTAILSRCPTMSVVGDAGDATEAQRRAEELKPDLILLDNHLPGVNGVDALPALRAALPNVRIILLTVSEDEDDLVAALRAGANGYLLKTMDADALVAAIAQVMRGQSRGKPTVDAHEVLSLLLQGLPNKLIARHLGIAETTVKIHVQHVLRKLNVASRVQAAVIAAGVELS